MSIDIIHIHPLIFLLHHPLSLVIWGLFCECVGWKWLCWISLWSSHLPWFSQSQNLFHGLRLSLMGFMCDRSPSHHWEFESWSWKEVLHFVLPFHILYCLYFGSRFRLKREDEDGGSVSYSITIPHNSLLIMHPPLQEEWEHQVRMGCRYLQLSWDLEIDSQNISSFCHFPSNQVFINANLSLSSCDDVMRMWCLVGRRGSI